MNEHSTSREERRRTDGGGAPRIESSISHRESIPDLVRQLAEDVSLLLGKELALARAELREAAQDVKAGVGGMVTGAGFVMSGILFVLLSAVLLLAQFIPTWAAALVVGAVVLLIGVGLVKANQRKMKPASLVPERTVQSVSKDRDMARRVAP